MQEAALAKTLIFLCGEHELHHDNLEPAVRFGSFAIPKEFLIPSHISYFRGKSFIRNHAAFQIRRFMQRRQGNQESGTAEDLLLMEVCYEMIRNGTQCSLPVDRIRGLLGFCEISEIRELRLEMVRDVERLYTLFR